MKFYKTNNNQSKIKKIKIKTNIITKSKIHIYYYCFKIYNNIINWINILTTLFIPCIKLKNKYIYNYT